MSKKYEFATPIYALPRRTWEAVPEDMRLRCVHVQHGDNIYVMAAPRGLRKVKLTHPDEFPAITMKRYRYRYVPTDAEVMRALRGPMGFAGPVGARGEKGDKGEIGSNEQDSRLLEQLSKMTDAHTRAISNLAITVTKLKKES